MTTGKSNLTSGQHHRKMAGFNVQCSMCVIVITPKMEWNQLGARYILTAFQTLLFVCYTRCFRWLLHGR